MKRLLLAATIAAAVLVSATPASAHVDRVAVAAGLTSPAGNPHDTASTSSEADDRESRGSDGTDPLEFLALLAAGVATVLALTALVYARHRAPQ